METALSAATAGMCSLTRATPPSIVAPPTHFHLLVMRQTRLPSTGVGGVMLGSAHSGCGRPAGGAAGTDVGEREVTLDGLGTRGVASGDQQGGVGVW